MVYHGSRKDGGSRVVLRKVNESGLRRHFHDSHSAARGSSIMNSTPAICILRLPTAVPAILAAVIAVLFASSASAAEAALAPDRDAWWIMLAPKELPKRALRLSDTPLTQRAVDRRAARGSMRELISSADLPIAQARIDCVTATGASLRTVSRWLNLASVNATPAELRSIVRLPFVRGAFPVHHSQRVELVESGEAVEGGIAGSGAWSDAQLTQIGVDGMHARGFFGAGQIIGVLDTGFHRSHAGFSSVAHPLDVIAEWDFINNDGNTGIEPGDPGNQHWHGSAVLGFMGAYLPGQMIGAAYEAQFILAKTEDVSSETPIEEDYYVAGLEFIEANGADIATSSLGYIDWYTPEQLDGVTAVTSRGVNIATALGMICCTAAGNQGNDGNPATNHLLAPADALQVISCGAVEFDGATAWFTSDGPSADGRVKPEVCARGVNCYTIDPNNPAAITSGSGTSFATPLVAGAVATVLQARAEYSVNAMRNALFTTASDMLANGTFDSLYRRGYGIMDALGAASINRDLEDINLDGFVGAADLAILLNAWGPCADICPTDFNNDGVVDAADLATLLASWGS